MKLINYGKMQTDQKLDAQWHEDIGSMQSWAIFHATTKPLSQQKKMRQAIASFVFALGSWKITSIKVHEHGFWYTKVMFMRLRPSREKNWKWRVKKSGSHWHSTLFRKWSLALRAHHYNTPFAKRQSRLFSTYQFMSFHSNIERITNINDQQKLKLADHFVSKEWRPKKIFKLKLQLIWIFVQMTATFLKRVFFLDFLISKTWSSAKNVIEMICSRFNRSVQRSWVNYTCYLIIFPIGHGQTLLIEAIGNGVMFGQAIKFQSIEQKFTWSVLGLTNGQSANSSIGAQQWKLFWPKVLDDFIIFNRERKKEHEAKCFQWWS